MKFVDKLSLPENVKAYITALRPISLIKYGVVGLINNATSFCCAMALVHLGLAGWMALGIIFPTATVITYVANRFWSFNTKNTEPGSFKRYCITYGIAVPLSLAVTYALENRLGNSWLAIIITMAIFPAAIYLIMNFFVFPASRTLDDASDALTSDSDKVDVGSVPAFTHQKELSSGD